MWKHSELRLQQGLDFTFANASTTCKRKKNTFNFLNYLIYVINIFFFFFLNSHSHQKKKLLMTYNGDYEGANGSN